MWSPPLYLTEGVMGLVNRTIGRARAQAAITPANMACNMNRWYWLDRLRAVA